MLDFRVFGIERVTQLSIGGAGSFNVEWADSLESSYDDILNSYIARRNKNEKGKQGKNKAEKHGKRGGGRNRNFWVVCRENYETKCIMCNLWAHKFCGVKGFYNFFLCIATRQLNYLFLSYVTFHYVGWLCITEK